MVDAADLQRSRRRLQVALGLLWLFDAALQFQPFMFGRAFGLDVIAPAAAGNPAPVARSVLWAAHVVAAHPVLWNALFATSQLALALGLLWPRTVRLALAASIGWSLLVWWLGEGFGGVLTGSGSLLMGAPGAVILYALLALIAWPSDRSGGSLAGSSVLGGGATAAWVVLWASEAYLLLLPANGSGSALHGMLAGMADGEPGWLASLDRWAGSAVGHGGGSIGLALGAVLALAALAATVPPALARPLLALTLLLSALVWSVGQDFGGILTGQATDLNSGPLLALVALSYWPSRRREAATADRRIRRRVLVTAAAAAAASALAAGAALAAGSGGSGTAPSRRTPSVQAGPGAVAAGFSVDGYRVELRLAPNRASRPGRFRVALSRAGRPVAGAQVSLTGAMLGMGSFTLTLPGRQPGVYSRPVPVVGMAGRWDWTVGVRVGGGGFSVRVVDRMRR